MTRVVSAIDSHPDFYADVIAAGGLAAALKQTAAELGLEIGAVGPAWDGSTADARIPAPAALLGRTAFTVTACRYRRSFRVDNRAAGVAWARGYTPDLAEVTRAAAAWCAGADPRGMKAVAPFIELPVLAEARATGSVDVVVEANWQCRRDAWSRHWRFEPDGWREPTELTGLRALFDAAYAEPRLRRLYAVTSHHILWFSQCTDHPFARVGGAIEPQSDGQFRVGLSRHRDESELFDTPQAAVAHAAAFLPPDCGPTVLGTAADIPS